MKRWRRRGYQYLLNAKANNLWYMFINILTEGRMLRCIIQKQKKSIAHKRNKYIFTPMMQALLNSCFIAYCNYLHHSSTGNTKWLIRTQRKKRVPMQRLPSRSHQHVLICLELQCLRELRLRSRTCRNSPSCSTI